MKKIGRILALVLCLGLLMSLCFGLTASAAAGDSKAAEKKEDSPEGQYEIFAVHNEGFTVDSAAMGMVSTLKLEKGGKGSFHNEPRQVQTGEREVVVPAAGHYEKVG